MTGLNQLTQVAAVKSFLIGELARRAGVNKETVRFYEAKGLLDPPTRRESGFHSTGYREYTDETVLHIKFIKQLQKLDFRLREIKCLFDLYESGARECDDFMGDMEAKIESIQSELDRLVLAKTTLSELLSKCEKGGLLDTCAAWGKLRRSEFLEEDS